MEVVLYVPLAALLYFSGLLVWPVCAFSWRKKGRRTTALRWVFGVQLTLTLVLIVFFAFSRGLLEHQYYWLIIMILLNLLFTPVAIVAAIIDSGSETQKG